MACRGFFFLTYMKHVGSEQIIVAKNNFTYQAIFVISLPYQSSYHKIGELYIPSSIGRFSLSGLRRREAQIEANDIHRAQNARVMRSASLSIFIKQIGY